MIQRWYKRYMKFSRQNAFVFYSMRIGEAILVAWLVSWLFKLNLTETVIITVVGVILTPVGYAFSKQKKKPHQDD